MTQIVVHKADQPDARVDFFHTDGLAGEGFAEIDFLSVQAQAAATGDHSGAVMEGVVWLGIEDGCK